MPKQAYGARSLLSETIFPLDSDRNTGIFDKVAPNPPLHFPAVFSAGINGISEQQTFGRFKAPQCPT